MVSVAGGSGGTELQGFTITGGSGSQGAAIYASAAAGTFADLLITDNTGTSGGQCTGSIVYSNGAVQPTWHNVDFIGNTVICGEAWGLIYARSGTAVLENVRFIDNVMQGESYLYGMAIAYNGRIEITNGVFAGNRGQAPSGSSVDIRGLIAGGIVSSFSLENVTIVGNEVDAGGGTALGGLFFVEDGFSGSLNNVTMTSNTFDDTSIVASVACGSVASRRSACRRSRQPLRARSRWPASQTPGCPTTTWRPRARVCRCGPGRPAPVRGLSRSTGCTSPRPPASRNATTLLQRARLPRVFTSLPTCATKAAREWSSSVSSTEARTPTNVRCG